MILLVLGPSGVGKSHLSADLQKERLLHHLRIDTDEKGKHTFEANGFPAEWDADPQSIDFSHFVNELGHRYGSSGSAGVVVSLPTTYRLSHQQLSEVSQLGVTPVVLWGSEEQCIRAAKERINRKGMKFNLLRYREQNGPTFGTYGRPDYDEFRVQAFQPDGSRYEGKELLERIMKRTYAG